jgi:hypothetical protein
LGEKTLNKAQLMVLIKLQNKEDKYGNKTIRNISRRKTKATDC